MRSSRLRLWIALRAGAVLLIGVLVPLAPWTLRNYLELQAWQVAAIKEGIAAADRGEVVDHAEVKAWLESWGTERELPPPRAK